MTYPCRCINNRCRHRRSFKRLPHEYINKPKCEKCGQQRWKVDVCRLHKEHKQRSRLVCKCEAYKFVHRKGYGACYFNEDDEARQASTWGREGEDETTTTTQSDAWSDQEFARMVEEIPD